MLLRDCYYSLLHRSCIWLLLLLLDPSLAPRVQTPRFMVSYHPRIAYSSIFSPHGLLYLCFSCGWRHHAKCYRLFICRCWAYITSWNVMCYILGFYILCIAFKLEQVIPEAELLSTMKPNWRFLKQVLRWTRNAWRSDLRSMFMERYIWTAHPYVAYTMVRFPFPLPFSANWRSRSTNSSTPSLSSQVPVSSLS